MKTNGIKICEQHSKAQREIGEIGEKSSVKDFFSTRRFQTAKSNMFFHYRTTSVHFCTLTYHSHLAFAYAHACSLP